MENLILIPISLMFLFTIGLFLVNRVFFCCSVILLYPIVGQCVHVRIPFVVATINPPMLFGIIVFALAAIDVITRPIKNMALELIITLFILYCALTSFLSPKPFLSISWTLKMGTWLSLLLMGLKAFTQKTELQKLQLAIATAAIIVILSFALSKLGVYGHIQNYGPGIKLYAAGFYSGKSIAYYLAVVVPVLAAFDVAITRIRKLLFSILIFLCVITIILTFVRAPVVALLTAFLFFQYLSCRYGQKGYPSALGFSLVVIIIVLLSFRLLSGTIYVERWTELADRVSQGELKKAGSGRIGSLIQFYNYYVDKAPLKAKLFGSGLGSSSILLGTRKFVHNDFAEILMGCGAIGLFVYVFILIKVFRLYTHVLGSMGSSTAAPKYLALSFSGLLMFLVFNMTNVTSGIFILTPWALWTGATLAVSENDLSRQ